MARVTPSLERGRVLGWIHLWWNAAMMAAAMMAAAMMVAAMMVAAMVGGAMVDRWPGLPFVIAGALNLGTIGLAIAFFGLEGWKDGKAEG